VRPNPPEPSTQERSRMNGTAVYGERVVVVEVNQGHVNLKTGRISSTGTSHVDADNRHNTVVFGDRQFYPTTDSPDEAYERSFRVDDIHLLKEEEVQSLQDPITAQTWFGIIYQDWVINRIHRALKRVNRA
jgi:hypothetical protein